MKQRIAIQLASLGFAVSLGLGAGGAVEAADWHATRTYFYAAPTYDDGPDVRYTTVVRERRVYGYAPALRHGRTYNYVAPGSRVVTRRADYDSYGPTYGYVAEPVGGVVGDWENRPLGVYAPATSQNLSESRRFFRSITRQSGGD